MNPNMVCTLSIECTKLSFFMYLLFSGQGLHTAALREVDTSLLRVFFDNLENIPKNINSPLRNLLLPEQGFIDYKGVYVIFVGCYISLVRLVPNTAALREVKAGVNTKINIYI